MDIRKPVKKFAPYLIEAQNENLNEADTVQRISKFFEEVLGYDAMRELSFETQMKNKFVDLCLKVDGTIKILVEAKAGGVRLRDRHIEQAQNYASRNNYRWVLLTNGVEWNLYHLTFEEGIEYDKAFAVDLSKDDLELAAEKLSLLHRRNVKRGAHDKYWDHQVALTPASIGKALFTEKVLRLLRREVRRRGSALVDQEDLAKALHEMLSTEAREQLGPMRITRQRRPRKEPVPDVAPVVATPTPAIVPRP